MFDSSKVDADSIKFACKVSGIVIDQLPDTISMKDMALGCLCSYALLCRACGIDEETCKLLADELLENAFQAMDKYGVQMFKPVVDA